MNTEAILNDAPSLVLIILALLVIALWLNGAAFWTNGKLALLWLLVVLFIAAMLVGGR